MLKKIGIGVVVLVLGLMLLGYMAGDPKGAKNVAQTDQPEQMVAPTAVTSVQLARAYEQNEVAAKAKYGNKSLKVTGTITAIELDFADNPTVQLRGVNEFLGVGVNLAGSDQAAIAKLLKGQKLTVTCQSLSEVISAPQLSDCAM